MKKFSEEINELINRRKYDEARRWIRVGLKWLPTDHWLLDRMSLTYHEQGKYREALKWSKKAYQHAKKCPMVLWGYASTLEEIGETESALLIYRKLLDKGTEAIAHGECGECGEGSRTATSLFADSAYRAALCYQQMRKFPEAERLFLKHLSMRDQGADSIYPETEVRENLSKLSRPVTSSAHTSESPTVSWEAKRTQTIQM